MAYEKEMPKQFFQFNGRTAYGYMPVYWDETKGDWQVVEGAHPMPTQDKELVNVKAELQAIKNQLNGTLSTQQTGSNVVLEKIRNVEIGAGATVTVRYSLPVLPYKWIAVNGGSDKAHSWTIVVRFDREDLAGAITDTSPEIRFPTTENRGQTEQVPIRGVICSIRIINSDSIAHTYDLDVIGGKF